MKEKRYFCDYCFGAIGIFLILFPSFIIASIGGRIHFNKLLSKYENELNSYDESSYQYLDEIANNVIQEGVGINLSALPDDVVKYEITSENNGVIFKLYLDNSIANMTIVLSDNYEIISKNPNYSSEEDYISNSKFILVMLSIMEGMIIFMCSMAVIFICITIAASVSYENKNLS